MKNIKQLFIFISIFSIGISNYAQTLSNIDNTTEIIISGENNDCLTLQIDDKSGLFLPDEIGVVEKKIHDSKNPYEVGSFYYLVSDRQYFKYNNNLLQRVSNGYRCIAPNVYDNPPTSASKPKSGSDFTGSEYFEGNSISDDFEAVLGYQKIDRSYIKNFIHVLRKMPEFQGIDKIKFSVKYLPKDEKSRAITKDTIVASNGTLMLHDGDIVESLAIYGGRNAFVDAIMWNGETYFPLKSGGFFDNKNGLIFKINTKVLNNSEPKLKIECRILNSTGQLVKESIANLKIDVSEVNPPISPFPWLKYLIIGIVTLFFIAVIFFILCYYKRKKLIKVENVLCKIREDLTDCRKKIFDIVLPTNLLNRLDKFELEIDKVFSSIKPLSEVEQLKQTNSKEVSQSPNRFVQYFNKLFLYFVTRVPETTQLIEEKTRLIKEIEYAVKTEKNNRLKSDIVEVESNLKNSGCNQTVRNYLNELVCRANELLDTGELDNAALVVDNLKSATSLQIIKPEISPNEVILSFVKQLLNLTTDKELDNGNETLRLDVYKLKNKWMQWGKESIMYLVKKSRLSSYISNLDEQNLNNLADQLESKPNVIEVEKIVLKEVEKTIYRPDPKIQDVLNQKSKELEDANILILNLQEAKINAENNAIKAETLRQSAVKKAEEATKERDQLIANQEELKKQYLLEAEIQVQEQLVSKDNSIIDLNNQLNERDKTITSLREGLEREISAREKEKIDAETALLKAVSAAVDEANKKAEIVLNAALESAQKQLNDVKLDLNNQLEDEKVAHQETKQKAKTDLEEAKQEAEKARTDADFLVNAANQDAEQKINNILQECKTRIDHIQSNATELINQVKNESEEKIRKVQNDADITIQKVRNEAEERIGSAKFERQNMAVSMQRHFVEVRSMLLQAYADANDIYKTEGDKLLDLWKNFYRPFDESIVAKFKAGEELPQKEILDKTREILLHALGNKYGFVATLTRSIAYSRISRDWSDWFVQQGVNLPALRRSYDEMIALLGYCGISLIVPSLYIDRYDDESFVLNVTDLNILSFVPANFDCRKEAGVVRDLVLPGYCVDGYCQANPEVWA